LPEVMANWTKRRLFFLYSASAVATVARVGMVARVATAATAPHGQADWLSNR